MAQKRSADITTKRSYKIRHKDRDFIYGKGHVHGEILIFNDLAEVIHDVLGFTKRNYHRRSPEGIKIANTILNVIVDALRRGEQVEIPKVGILYPITYPSFKGKFFDRGAHTFVNKTTSPHTVIKFRMAAAMERALLLDNF